MRLLTRKLGRTNLEVTALGMGGAGIGRSNVTDAEAISAIHKAIDLGINYLDTAPLYGESERRVGLALQGGKRHQLHLATKTGTHPKWKSDYSSQGTRRSVEYSLKLLKQHMKHIHLYPHQSNQSLKGQFHKVSLNQLQREKQPQKEIHILLLNQFSNLHPSLEQFILLQTIKYPK